MGNTAQAAHWMGRAFARRGRERPLPSEDLTQPAQPEAGADGETIRAFLYDARGLDGFVSLETLSVEDLNEEKLLWIDVAGEKNLARAAAALGLEAETVRELHATPTDPVLYVHAGYIHVAVIAPGNGELGHEPRALHCVVGPNWVLTAHCEPVEFLAALTDQIRGNSGLGTIDGPAFLAAILQEHVASYLGELRPIERELDRVDLRSMTGRMDEEVLLRELVGTRLRLVRLRRLLEPHREFYARLSRSEFAVLSGAKSASDFAALSELLERTLQSMETTRDMIAGSFEIFTTWTAHGTNQLMRRLTVASVTLLPPTLLAGVMGMNSLPTSLTTPIAFFLSTAFMASLGLGVLTVARLRRWI